MTHDLVRKAVVAVAVATLALAAGCSGDDPGTTPSGPARETPAAPPAAPPARACYDLDFDQAAKPTSDARPVQCRSTHTAETIHVGTIRPVVDGHLLAVDSDTVQAQIARRCRARYAAFVGGSTEARRLSRLAVVWFSPTLAQSDQGALWFRCDVVALAGHDRLATLPRRVRGILDAPGALDRYGTCGTASPASKRFQRVICSQRHTWRARATVALPRGSAYLGRRAGATANSTCHDIDARLAEDILRLRWSFEWPTRQQWDAGQRFGYCWTPDPA
ncbi:MAG TPA: septum formation family protein [Marmoricola sp.]|nr:septum formation family protein [Marmoricola sp.]